MEILELLRHPCRFSGRAWGRLPSPLAALLGSNTGGKCVTKTQVVARDRTRNAKSLEQKKKKILAHTLKNSGIKGFRHSWIQEFRCCHEEFLNSLSQLSFQWCVQGQLELHHPE